MEEMLLFTMMLKQVQHDDGREISIKALSVGSRYIFLLRSCSGEKTLDLTKAQNTNRQLGNKDKEVSIAEEMTEDSLKTLVTSSAVERSLWSRKDGIRSIT